MKSRSELIRSIQAAIGTDNYYSVLSKESLEVLTKLNTLPSDTVRGLLDKVLLTEKLKTLKTGQQPEMFDGFGDAKINVLLWGPPGRGKSVLAEVIAKAHAAKVGGVFTQLVLPEDTPVSVVAGGYQPGPDNTWRWVDGPVSHALRHGGACNLEELAHASPEASCWLLKAMDGSPEITLPSGEVIVKKPVWFVSTQNDTPASLLPPLADRHEVQLNVTLPHAWAWLGNLAPLAERDLTTQEAASLRPWAALRRALNAGIPLERATAALWPDSPSQASAIKLALDGSN